MQYAATVLFMMTLALYGFVQPYKEKVANMLEVIFSIDTIVLLLLQETSTINDAIGILSISYSTLNSSSDDCISEFSSITPFTWLLFPFYYMSLLITSVTLAVWSIVQIRCVSNVRCICIQYYCTYDRAAFQTMLTLIS